MIKKTTNTYFMLLLCFIIFNIFSLELRSNLLKIATFNTKLLPLPFLLTELPTDQITFTPFTRAILIAKQFADYDIVAFQEAIHFLDSWALKKEMRKNGFKYSTAKPGESYLYLCKGYIYTGGVQLFSKHPILNQDTTVFESSYGKERLSAKGAVYAKISFSPNDPPLNFFALHTQSSKEENSDTKLEKKHEEKRFWQFFQLKKFIDNQYIPEQESIIVMGDFNVDRESVFTNYKTNQKKEFNKILKLLNATPFVDHIHESLPYSLDTQNNSMAKAQYGGKEIQATLDHILCVFTTNDSRINHPCIDPEYLFPISHQWIHPVKFQNTSLSDHHAVTLMLETDDIS